MEKYISAITESTLRLELCLFYTFSIQKSVCRDDNILFIACRKHILSFWVLGVSFWLLKNS